MGLCESTINKNVLQEPSYHEIFKSFWNTGDIAINIKTYTSFASEQTIPIEISITNETKVKIYKISVALIQVRNC
jgi:hypothetical protein